MGNLIFPGRVKDWSTLKKLIYLRGSPAGGGERYATVTGNLVTFTAKRAAPLRKLEVAIEPVQNTHGYDPFPNGASKNLIPNGTDTSNGYSSDHYLKSDGTTASDTTYYISEYFPITAGSQYVFNGNNADANAPAVCFYDSGKNFISGVNANKQFPHIITAPEGAAYARCSQSYIGYFSAYGLQFEAGSTPTTVKPYGNVCAITGWGDFSPNVITAGKNLYFRDSLDRYGNYIRLNGIHNPNNDDIVKRAYGIYLKGGQTYRVHVDTGLSSTINYGLYAMRTGWPGQINVQGSASRITIDKTWTPPADGWYCFWLYTTSASSVVLANVIFYIAEGDAAYDSSVAPATRKIFPIPTPPGTVYGGTLDVLTGVLTVDKVKVTLTNTVNFNKVGTGTRVYFMLWESNSLFSGIRAKNNSAFVSDKFTNVPSSTDAYNGWFTSDGSFQFYLDESITTGDAAKTWLGSNNVDIVYTLKEPVTYQLTPEEVSTLVGANTLWTDAAAVTVEYRSN